MKKTTMHLKGSLTSARTICGRDAESSLTTTILTSRLVERTHKPCMICAITLVQWLTAAGFLGDE